jgi:hypothetical protein
MKSSNYDRFKQGLISKTFKTSWNFRSLKLGYILAHR